MLFIQQKESLPFNGLFWGYKKWEWMTLHAAEKNTINEVLQETTMSKLLDELKNQNDWKFTFI